MGKNKDGRRATKKNRRKNKFKKMGKNTIRGMRIKETNVKKISKRKKIYNHFVDFHMKCSKNKGNSYQRGM